MLIDRKIVQASAACERHLIEMEKLFAPHVRLTLLVRNTQAEDSDIFLSVDNIDDVIAAITRLKTSPECTPAGLASGEWAITDDTNH